ncbi:hypothetical protein DH2020_014286 [Rehmannia glutinosa]|uniref:Reverse transcriptase Ty1/copia-type domain-containing protein n=1 Tax=Rehmannia glutinosa TaxID=99300 RepID=A0ABR0WYI3_REHGL
MEQPEGYVAPGQEQKVCKLVNLLYGLKQAPKQWHEKFDSTMKSNGFKINECDKCFYIKGTTNDYVIVCLYVDDMLIMGSSHDFIMNTKNMLKRNFDMKDIGLSDVILGIKISRTSDGIVLSQSHYVESILRRFNAFNSPPAKTPVDLSLHLAKNRGKPVSQLEYEYARIIGSLMYLTNCTRPDIAYSVSKLSRFTSNPSTDHWKAVTRVLRYLKDTMNYGILYTRYPAVLENENFSLKGYSDSDYTGNIDDRKSTFGSCQFLGDCLVSWFSKKQNCVSLSTAEAEYISAAFCCTQLLWMKQTLVDYKCSFENVPIFCDNISAINIAQNSVHHNNTKHIEIRHHFLRDCVSKRKIEISFVPSQDQLADIFTKPLSSDTFASTRARLGIMHIE